MHRSEVLDAVAIELGCCRVRIDDASAVGIEEQLDGPVVLEHLPVALLAVSERVVDVALLDGRGHVLRDELQHFSFRVAKASGLVVGLCGQNAPCRIAGA